MSLDQYIIIYEANGTQNSSDLINPTFLTARLSIKNTIILRATSVKDSEVHSMVRRGKWIFVQKKKLYFS